MVFIFPNFIFFSPMGPLLPSVAINVSSGRELVKALQQDGASSSMVANSIPAATLHLFRQRGISLVELLVICNCVRVPYLSSTLSGSESVSIYWSHLLAPGVSSRVIGGAGGSKVSVTCVVVSNFFLISSYFKI